jgi:hypothetical protein
MGGGVYAHRCTHGGPPRPHLIVQWILLMLEPVLQSKTYFACVRQRIQYICPFFGNKIRQTLDRFFVAVGGRTQIVFALGGIVSNLQQFLNFDSPVTIIYTNVFVNACAIDG